MFGSQLQRRIEVSYLKPHLTSSDAEKCLLYCGLSLGLLSSPRILGTICYIGNQSLQMSVVQNWSKQSWWKRRNSEIYMKLRLKFLVRPSKKRKPSEASRSSLDNFYCEANVAWRHGQCKSKRAIVGNSSPDTISWSYWCGLSYLFIMNQRQPAPVAQSVSARYLYDSSLQSNAEVVSSSLTWSSNILRGEKYICIKYVYL